MPDAVEALRGEAPAGLAGLGGYALMVALVALASAFGLEVILGAFLAGIVLALVDQDERGTSSSASRPDSGCRPSSSRSPPASPSARTASAG